MVVPDDIFMAVHNGEVGALQEWIYKLWSSTDRQRSVDGCFRLCWGACYLVPDGAWYFF